MNSNHKFDKYLKPIKPNWTVSNLYNVNKQRETILDEISKLINAKQIIYNDDDELIMIGYIKFNDDNIYLFCTIIKGLSIIHINLDNSVPNNINELPVANEDIIALFDTKQNNNITQVQ